MPVLTGIATLIVAVFVRRGLLRVLSRREAAQQLVPPAPLPSLLWAAGA
jgi:hypothetical protein